MLRGWKHAVHVGLHLALSICWHRLFVQLWALSVQHMIQVRLAHLHAEPAHVEGVEAVNVLFH
jgi:hypothetical protein